jgi:hypothetical protein
MAHSNEGSNSISNPSKCGLEHMRELWSSRYDFFKCYGSVWSGQPSYGGGGTLFILETQIIGVGVKIPGLVR